MAITVQRSIQLEQLADALARTLREPMGMPFRKEVILVDGKALSNWLGYYLVNEADLGDGSRARGLGVHMQAELMNTTRFATWAKLAFANQPDSERLEDPLATLPTRIFRWLGENPSTFELPTEAGDGGAARLDLAQRIAQWLKELIRDDPAWVTEAETRPAGRLERLWQAMAKEIRADEGLEAKDPLTAVDVLVALRGDPRARQALADRVPGRIHLFATSDVSITLLQSLKALTGDIDVHTHLLQPSTGFHLDLDSASRAGRIGYEQVGGETIEQGIPMETPGSLFLRQTARHFRRQLKVTIDELEAGGECEEGVAFAPTVLGGLKEAIANFDAPKDQQAKRAQDDGSVRIHRCHTALREVEVLRDEILRAMSADPALRARDVLVLSPDPATYAPLMSGVLMLRTPSIGFGTAGVEGSTKSPLADLATRLLELPSGRFTAQEVLEICELSVVRDKFGWDIDKPARVRRWFQEAPFFWGMDGRHRERMTGSAFSDWSAADFVDRLSLGTALRGDMNLAGDGDVETLPLDGVEGREDLRLAADLMTLVDRLRAWSTFAEEPRRPLEWVATFSEHLSALLPDEGESADERVLVDRALAAVQAACEVAGEQAIDLATFRTLALPHLDIDYARGQFLSGGVTLAPLRAGNVHPAKMIALIGMGDGAYPRRGQAPGPELATARPTQAERGRDQSEQRGMHTVMLAISAAQQRLVLTFPGFVGDSGKDTAAALPVELIRMACATICPGFKVKRHGLHSHEAGRASDDDPFGEAATHTTDAGALAVAASLGEARGDPPTPTLTLDASTWPLEEWLDFWRNPVRGAFERAQAIVPWTNEELPADEPLETGRDWSIRVKRKAERWFQSYLNKHNEAPDWAVAKATGFFPLTPNGHAAYMEMSANLAPMEPGVEPMDDEFAHFMGRHRAKALEIDHGTTHFLRALHNGSWLVLSLGKDKIKEGDLLRGIAALAYLQREHPKLRNVAVIGQHGVTETGKPSPKGLGATGAPADLRKRLGELASLAVSREMVLGPKVFEEAAVGAITPKKDGSRGDGAGSESLTNFTDTGDASDRHARLVLSGGLNFEAINDRLHATFGDMRRITAKDIPKTIDLMPDKEPNA